MPDLDDASGDPLADADGGHITDGAPDWLAFDGAAPLWGSDGGDLIDSAGDVIDAEPDDPNIAATEDGQLIEADE